LFVLKRITTKNKKVFFLYLLVIAILVLIGFISLYVYGAKSAYHDIARVYNVIEYTFLAYFFSLYIKNNIVKKVLFYSPIPFFIFCIIDFLNAKESTIPFLPVSIEYLVLLVFIIYFFFEVLQENLVEPIYSKAIFWIAVAFIINFSGNFFLFIYSKVSFKDEAFQSQFTIIYSTVTILKDILLCIGVIMKENNKINHISSTMPLETELDTFYPFQ
jgi:hypothetical protein